MTVRSLLAVTVAAALISPAHAQAQRWSAELQAGQIRSSLDPAAAAQTLAVGVTYDDFNTALGLSVGVPVSSTEPLWGALGGSQRLVVRHAGFLAGVDLSGSAYLLHQRAEQRRVVRGPFGAPQLVTDPAVTGHALAGQALPLIGYEAAHWQLQLRTGPSFYRNRFGDAERERQVLVSDAQLTITPTSSVALMPIVRRFHADSADYTYAGSSAIIAGKLGSLWASAGFWPGLDTVSASWAVGATWQLHERATLSFSGRRDAFDALYLNPPQTTWSLGFTVQFAGATPVRAPIPASYHAGQATIRLDAGDTRTAPRIAGDFTNWKPRPMQRAGDAWIYTTELAPGVYNYAFVDQGGNWFVPEDHPGRKDDGMGGTVAVLVVR